MKRRKEVCFCDDKQSGEHAVTLCGLSILNARIHHDWNQVTCVLCQNMKDEIGRIAGLDLASKAETTGAEVMAADESDTDPTPDDDRELIPFLREAR